MTAGGDEVEVQVRNVTLDELKASPYRATVDFDKVYYAPGSRQEHKRETFVAQVIFVLRDQIPNAMVLVNPLGLTITYFRVDQAFQ
jgi:type IV secretory pathway component VirB8